MYRILVMAQNVGNRKKGYISDIRPITTEWGNKETLPNFIRVEVTDGVTWQQAKAWQEPWVIKYIFTTLQDELTFAQYKVEVDPEVISASDKGKAQIKQEMRDHIENCGPDSLFYGCTIDAFMSNSMTITAPKPHSKQALKDEFKDIFQDTLEIDRYYFESSGVDWAISQGGSVQITQAQALNNIVDKFTE